MFMKIEEWLDTDLGQKIWNNKYRFSNESLEEWFNRVSGNNQKVKQLIKDKKFLFGGRTLNNRGLGLASSSNCYSIGFVKDSLEDIMETNTQLALTYKAEGGQGVSLSLIRPKGSLIKGRYTSDGIVPFMEIFNTTTSAIKQGGCISEDQRVLTNKGYIPIKDVKIGDLAWTKIGWVPVNYVFDKGIQKTYEVITEKGYRIETTIDHKYCIDGFNSKPLSELKIGDRINLIADDKGQFIKSFNESETPFGCTLKEYEGEYTPIIFDTIVEINELKEKHVYDLSLEKEHYFMCEGFYVSNSRKGALMMSIDITHKEAETFITIKSDLNRINNANLSVEIDDEFMNVVKKSYETNTELPMHCYRKYDDQELEYTIIPIKLYKLLIKQAHLSAEPGVIYTKRFRNYNLMEFCDDYQIENCNPCGEQPLPKHGACNLGSINLASYVEWGSKDFDFETFKKDVATCIEGLDEVITENIPYHALPEQREMAFNYRNVGLGIMGFADMFIKMGIIYGSPESLKVTDAIMKEMLKAAVVASVNLAKQKGVFPKYRPELFDATILKNVFTERELKEFKQIGIRNCSLLSIAPTGSLGTMLNISTGIEPNFALEYIRKTESLEGNKESTHKVFAGIALDYSKKFNTSTLPDYFVTSHVIDWRDRIKIQSIAQNYVDTAISATINLHETITVEEVEMLYIDAWEKGLKGVTIYRDNCRQGILTLDTPKEKVTNNFFERGEILDAKVIHFINEDTPWIAFIGVKEGKPFEIFSGPADMESFPIPKSVKDGEIIKVKEETSSRYDFRYKDKYGYINTLGGLSRMFNKEYWNYARLISGMFRNQTDLDSIINIVEGMYSETESLHSWKNGVIRSIKTFIGDGTTTKEKCPECGGDMIYTNGCKQCNSCGWSKCS